MLFSRNKKSTDFSNILSDSLVQIELGNFDDALKNYFALSDLAEKNNKKQDKNFIIFYNLMKLYLKTIELREYYQNSDFSNMKYTLEYMRPIILETKMLSSGYLASIDFFEKHLQEYSRIYMYHFYWSQMVTQLKHIYTLLEIGVGDNAKLKYGHVLRIYNKLVGYATQSQRDRIYKQLLKLKEEIDFVTLKEKAYSKASVIKTNDKQFTTPHIEVEKREFLGNETYNFDNKFSKMHDYIKRNNLDGALRLYEQI